MRLYGRPYDMNELYVARILSWLHIRYPCEPDTHERQQSRFDCQISEF